MANAIIIGILIGPAVLLTILRANAAATFLSVCLGAVLLKFLSNDVTSLASVFTAPGSTTGHVPLRLALLLLPVVLTMLFTIRSVAGGRLLINFVAAVAVGFLLFLLVQPFFSAGLNGTLATSKFLPLVHQFQASVIAVGALVTMPLLLRRPQAQHDGKKHHK